MARDLVLRYARCIVTRFHFREQSPDLQLKDKTALVTGAGMGIGHAILTSPDVRQLLSAEGAVGDTPEQFAAFMKTEIARWAKAVVATDIKAE